eukprot:TRINITY_DN7873_c0_g1_i2.p1 TRINITY_DN7873_c0_g1~~TRINITY_DN7873_c0_g1_i2.p1  ORF type:complete len:537 (-),score=126.61 TRINITY_DN7873_c0_g1_i2:561-2171(-)
MEHSARGAIFYENDKEVILRNVPKTTSQSSKWNDDAAFAEFFDIASTVDLINQNDFKSIALQFPDELLEASSKVSSLLRNHTGRALFVLGDTSYGSCCVDEVAAEHIKADVIVHYGRACLSKTSRLPVIYVFGRSPVHSDDCFAKLCSQFPDKDAKVLIFYDLSYSHVIETISAKASSAGYRNFITTKIQKGLHQPASSGSVAPPNQPDGCCGGSDPQCNQPSSGEAKAACESQVKEDSPSEDGLQRFGGRSYCLAQGSDIKDYAIFYIGEEGPTLTNLMMNFGQNKFYTYNPTTSEFRQETLNVNRALMKRYYVVQQAKDAEVFGIVVGTLGVARYLDIIEHLKEIIRASDKRFYTFVVGKLNVPKLANFQEIDAFVMVACPENTLIDSKEFLKPIATPFEMEIAHVRGKEWTGEYTTDFAKVLPGMNPKEGNEIEHFEEDDEDMRFSLLTGTMKKNHKKKSNETQLKGDEGAIVNRNENTEIVESWSAATQFLKGRSYQGLEVKLGETEVVKAVEGRSGIPKSYGEEEEMEKRT